MAEEQPSAAAVGPAIVVGLGAFGDEVLARLRRARMGSDGAVAQADAGARGRAFLVHGAADALASAQAIVDRAEDLLGFAAAMAGDPGDERRPQLDVYLVADVSEPDAAAALPLLLSESARRLLRRFSNIFPGHDLPNLSICPVVAMRELRREGGPDPRATLAALEEHARKIGFRSGGASPIARVFVVEQQSSRYELRSHEVVSTVAAFLALVLGTDLRSREPLRSFLRSPIEHARDGRIFASFGCATLELDIGRYCVTRAAGELVESLRSPEAAAAGAEMAAAERWVPTAHEVALGLQTGDGRGDDLVALLRAHTPVVEFPEIGEHDTPEQVREVAYGWGWFAALEAAVAAQVERLDEREMDEVTRVADERGLARLRRLVRSARAAIRDAEREGAHGWARGRRLAEQVRDRAAREHDALASELRDAELPPFPETAPVESAFRELREEAGLRPRPHRMLFFGTAAAVALAALLHHVPKWIAVALVARQVPILSLAPSSMHVEVGLLRYALDPPWVFLWLCAFFGTLVHLWLRRHRDRRHARLLDARDGLRASVRRYLSDDVGPSVRRYYESRLSFSLRAWALRALERLRVVADAEARRLAAVGAALDRLARELADEARRVESQGRRIEGDLVYRTQISSELLARTYEATRPGADLADRLLAEIETSEEDGEVPPYLFRERLERFVEPLAAPSPEALGRLAGPSVAEFVLERHGKLGVPLEVRSLDERSVEQRYVFAPVWAIPALSALRERLPTMPRPQPHDDRDRVHLLALQTALSRESIALPERKSS